MDLAAIERWMSAMRYDPKVERWLLGLGFDAPVARVASGGFDNWFYRYKWDREIIPELRSLARDGFGPWDQIIYLGGNNGTGKTLAAAMVCVEMLHAGWCGDGFLLINDKLFRREMKTRSDEGRGTSDLEAPLRMMWKRKHVSYWEDGWSRRTHPECFYQTPHPLILDELANDPSPFMFSYWLGIINEIRAWSKHLIIITSNRFDHELGDLELQLTGTKAVTDRLNDGIIYRFAGESFRAWLRQMRSQQRSTT